MVSKVAILDNVLSGTDLGMNPVTMGSGTACSVSAAIVVLGGGAPSSLNT